MKGLVTVFGCGGFIGRYVAEELLKRGWRVRAAERDPQKAWSIKPLGNLGQTQFVSANVTDAESVRRAVQGSDAVINLVGIFGSARKMTEVNAKGAANVAAAAKEVGARSLVQISAIGADAESESAYGRSKAEGEAKAREAFPAATIMRPSLVFGPGDTLLNMFAGLVRSFPGPFVPVFGADTKFQPVFAGDIADAVANALENPTESAGKTFELGGPETLTMEELNRFVAKQIGRDRHFLPVADPFAHAIALTTGWLPGAPMTVDQFRMLKKDNVVSDGANSLADLGIAPTAMETIAPSYLTRFRKHGRFAGVTAS